MAFRSPWLWFFAAASVFLFCVNGCNTDETDNTTTDGAPGVDVTGAWDGTFSTAGATGDFDFTMTMDQDGEVEGINTRLGRFTGDVTGNRFTIDSTDVFATIWSASMTMSGTFTDSETGDVATFTATKK